MPSRTSFRNMTPRRVLSVILSIHPDMISAICARATPAPPATATQIMKRRSLL